MKTGRITKIECEYIDLLYGDGNTVAEIARQLDRSEESILKHIVKNKKSSIKEEKVHENTGRQNLFVDDGTLHASDKELDKVLCANIKPTVKGTRKTPQVNSQCKSCEIREIVDATLSFNGRHLCVECTRTYGGG